MGPEEKPSGGVANKAASLFLPFGARVRVRSTWRIHRAVARGAMTRCDGRRRTTGRRTFSHGDITRKKDTETTETTRRQTAEKDAEGRRPRRGDREAARSASSLR